MIAAPAIFPFAGYLAAVFALKNVRFVNSPVNSARLGTETSEADVWPAAPTMPPHLRFAAIPLKPRDSSQNCGYFETTPSPQRENGPPIGAIVGGAIAGLVVMGLIVTAIVWIILRNRKKTSKDDDNYNGGPAVAGTNQPYTYSTVPAPGATSEWQSQTPAPTYEPYKSNHQPANSGAYQYQSTTPSQSPDPTSRFGALPTDYSSNRISEVPAINLGGTGNNASELHFDHVQRTQLAHFYLIVNVHAGIWM
ncbi:uncharacterized protein BDZ83DRAFT_654799 [Colletotrichum acutatum]|uniref:Uncharacterized protein n=1 Tax=Glomerella acutata TaxID=27357 RepID=A0AAD8UJ60_GLOAC|nr:uncharacterized protein BDZ83DRAFT_654799 [Colletotrichum acutatum]KAK1719406.1 hypothetical protein BDZ83DRAFT_654799 [Colletotrichum acutatum]